MSAEDLKLKNPNLLNDNGDRIYGIYSSNGEKGDPYYYIDITRRFVDRMKKNHDFNEL